MSQKNNLNSPNQKIYALLSEPKGYTVFGNFDEITKRLRHSVYQPYWTTSGASSQKRDEKVSGTESSNNRSARRSRPNWILGSQPTSISESRKLASMKFLKSKQNSAKKLKFDHGSNEEDDSIVIQDSKSSSSFPSTPEKTNRKKKCEKIKIRDRMILSQNTPNSPRDSLIDEVPVPEFKNQPLPPKPTPKTLSSLKKAGAKKGSDLMKILERRRKLKSIDSSINIRASLGDKKDRPSKLKQLKTVHQDEDEIKRIETKLKERMNHWKRKWLASSLIEPTKANATNLLEDVVERAPKLDDGVEGQVTERMSEQAEMNKPIASMNTRKLLRIKNKRRSMTDAFPGAIKMLDIKKKKRLRMQASFVKEADLEVPNTPKPVNAMRLRHRKSMSPGLKKMKGNLKKLEDKLRGGFMKKKNKNRNLIKSLRG